MAALGGAGSHSAFDVSEHFQHRDEHERDNDHGPRAEHGHIGGYVDEGDVDFAPPVDWVAIKFLEGDQTMYQAAYPDRPAKGEHSPGGRRLCGARPLHTSGH